MRRLVFLALAVALVAGCGGSSRLSKTQYQQKLQADGKAVQKTITALSGGASAGSLATIVKRVDSAEAAVKSAADDLGSLKPPADAAADNATIVTALRTIQSGLERLKKAASSGDFATAQKVGASIETSPQVKAAEKATADLKAKGYTIGVFGS